MTWPLTRLVVASGCQVVRSVETWMLTDCLLSPRNWVLDWLLGIAPARAAKRPKETTPLCPTHGFASSVTHDGLVNPPDSKPSVNARRLNMAVNVRSVFKTIDRGLSELVTPPCQP